VSQELSIHTGIPLLFNASRIGDASGHRNTALIFQTRRSALHFIKGGVTTLK